MKTTLGETSLKIWVSGLAHSRSAEKTGDAARTNPQTQETATAMRAAANAGLRVMAAILHPFNPGIWPIMHSIRAKALIWVTACKGRCEMPAGGEGRYE
jgi:hypothetical protein